MERVGRYRLEEKLGAGGMGTVYLGRDELLERRVAVKQLHPHRSLDEESRLRFLREARVVSQLAHPGICRVYDFLEHDGQQFLILEYIDGVSLRDAVREERLELEDRFRVAEALAEALAAAHASGVVHRDLKPENVMLRAGGGVAVLDFGLARSAGTLPDGEQPDLTKAADTGGRLTQDDVVVGTPGFISPEQLVGEPGGMAGDVYSLGLVFQELFTGRPAFDRSKPMLELFQDVRQGRRRPLDLKNRLLEDLIDQMAAMDPGARPSADSVRARLNAIREAPLVRRRRRLVSLAAVAAVVLALAGGEVLRRWVLPAPVLEAGERARVAVLPFEETPGDEAGLGVATGLAGMVAQSLGGHPRLDTVPMSEILAASRPVLEQGEVQRTELESLAKRLDARILVSGVLHIDQRGLELTGRILDRLGGEQNLRVRGRDIPELLTLTTSELARRIAPGTTLVDARERFSPDPLASLAYAAGEGRRLKTGAEAALPYFRVGWDRDPGFWQARSAEAACLYSLGEWKKSKTIINGLLTDRRGSGDRLAEIMLLQQRGGCELRLGEVQEAESTWRRALDLAQEADQTSLQGGLLSNLGIVAQKQGRFQEAGELYRRAARLAVRNDRRSELANSLLNLGSASRFVGRTETARRYFEQALRIYRSLDRTEDMGLAEYNLGVVDWMEGRLDQAEQHFSTARSLQESAGNRLQAAEVLEGLSALSWTRKRFQEAADRLTQAMDVYKELQHDEGVARASGNLANVQRDLGDWKKAASSAETCIRLADELGFDPSAVACREILAQVLALTGSVDEAATVLSDSRLDDNGPGTMAARALVAYGRGLYREAHRLMDRAVREAAAPEAAIFAAWLENVRKAERSGKPLPRDAWAR